MTDVMGGNVTFMFYPISGLQEFLGTKRLKALAITTGTRHALFPDVPTMKEQGYSGFEDSHSWSGMLAPAGTPPDIIQKLSETVMKSAAGGAMKKRGEQTGSTIVGSTPKEFAAFLARDGERWRRVLDSAGIKPE
jgi:tripartite-type tricarboxylate transporter receptor subunit TctC